MRLVGNGATCDAELMNEVAVANKVDRIRRRNAECPVPSPCASARSHPAQGQDGKLTGRANENNQGDKCTKQIQGSLHFGGKGAAFGRDDVFYWKSEEDRQRNVHPLRSVLLPHPSGDEAPSGRGTRCLKVSWRTVW